MNVYLGRQPIFDRAGNIYGYELLYRNSEKNSFPNINPEQATISLLINAFITIGLDKIAGGRYSFVNFTEKLLLDESLNIHPEQIVIEILEDVNTTPEMIMRLRQLKKEGFKIALDDFVLTAQSQTYPELFELVHFIKVDFLNSTPENQKAILNLVNDYPNITLVAEKIETENDYNQAKKLGYSLFQGYFFARPEIIHSKDIPPNYTLHFHVFSMLNKKEPDFDKVAEYISRDISLSYKMLRYINSFAFDIPAKITSIKQALVLMGTNEARKWIQIILIHDMGRGDGNGRIRAVVELSLTRAKLCELVAKHKGKQDADKYFLMALFSLIDVILKRRKEEIVPLLSLSEDIMNTLMDRETDMMPYLQLVKAIESLDLEKIKTYTSKINIEKKVIANFTHEAFAWMNQFNEQ